MTMTEKNVIVIAGPSGSGKNSVIEALITKCKGCSRLVTATTRAPRPGEKNGLDYHFLSEERFMEALGHGDILEHRYVKSLGTNYGVYKPDLEGRIALGEIVLAHLDIVGARYLKEHYGATTIFILPDSFEILEKRVRTRNRAMTDSEIKARMEIARTEIDTHAAEYDYRVVNADGKFDETVKEVIEILKKEGYNLE